MVLLKRIGSAPWVQKTIGALVVEYLRLFGGPTARAHAIVDRQAEAAVRG
jgi:hypothetical protein